MRADAELVLMAMGYSSLHDFSASTNEAGDVVITWLAATPMPSEVEIDAFVNPASALATRTAQAYKAAATAGIVNGQLQAEYSATFVSLAQSLQFMSTIVAPLLGAWLATYIGLGGALLLSAGLRLLRYLLFLRRDVRSEMNVPVAE